MDSHYLTASAADNPALENLRVNGMTPASSGVAASRSSAEIQITSVRNPHARALRTPGKSVDRCLAVFRRKLASWKEPGIAPGLSLL